MTETDQKATLDERLDELDIEETRYVYRRALAKTDKEAYKAVGVSWNWLKAHGADKLNGLAAELARDTNLHIKMLIEQHGVEAVKELIDEMGNRDVRVRSNAATKLLEWQIGKPTQKIDQKTDNSGTIKVEYVNDWRDPSADAS
jgi:hypothetical protein